MTGGAPPAATRGGALVARAGGALATLSLAFFGWVTVTTLGFPLPDAVHTRPGMIAVLVLGLVAGATRLRRVVWAGAALLATALLVVALTPVVRAPASRLVRADAWPATPVDAVVVLSGGITDDARLNGAGAERLLAGFETARAHGVPTVVTTRLRTRRARREVTSDADQRALARLAGGGTRLLTVGEVASTRDEAVRVARLARDSGWAAVAVVTSPSHTRRACATFERTGLRVTCVVAPSRAVAWETLHSAGDRMEAFAALCYEALATAVYRRRGWV